MEVFDADATARLLDFAGLSRALADVMAAYDRREIACPERLVVRTDGRDGALLSMPCVAPDLLVHKLLTIFPGNGATGLPAIQGHVTAFDGNTGRPLFGLDGPTVTARRTAAVTLLGIARLSPRPPRSAFLIGTGAQAFTHVQALLDRYPDLSVAVRGRSRAAEQAFCDRAGGRSGQVSPAGDDNAADVVIAVTSSTTPVYDEEPDPARLVVGVGAYRLDMVEIGARTIAGSQVYVDDPVGAPGEAGDVVAAGTDWTEVRSLATASTERPDPSRPVFLKSVGCAAWDYAACRVAKAAHDGVHDLVD